MDKAFMFIAFNSTHQAIRFEKLLIELFAIELIPTPREITASCGLSLKFECEDHNQVLLQLEGEDKTGIQLFQYDLDQKEKRIVPLKWR